MTFAMIFLSKNCLKSLTWRWSSFIATTVYCWTMTCNKVEIKGLKIINKTERDLLEIAILFKWYWTRVSNLKWQCFKLENFNLMAALFFLVLIEEIWEWSWNVLRLPFYRRCHCAKTGNYKKRRGLEINANPPGYNDHSITYCNFVKCYLCLQLILWRFIVGES